MLFYPVPVYSTQKEQGLVFAWACVFCDKRIFIVYSQRLNYQEFGIRSHYLVTLHGQNTQLRPS